MTSWPFQFLEISQENILVSLVQLSESLKLWFTHKVGLRWYVLFKSWQGAVAGDRVPSFPGWNKKKKRNPAMLKIKSLRVLHKIMYFCSISPDYWLCTRPAGLPSLHKAQAGNMTISMEKGEHLAFSPDI